MAIEHMINMLNAWVGVIEVNIYVQLRIDNQGPRETLYGYRVSHDTDPLVPTKCLEGLGEMSRWTVYILSIVVIGTR